MHRREILKSLAYITYTYFLLHHNIIQKARINSFTNNPPYVRNYISRTLDCTISAGQAKTFVHDCHILFQFQCVCGTVFHTDTTANTTHLAGIFCDCTFFFVGAFRHKGIICQVNVYDFLGTRFCTKTAANALFLINFRHTICIIKNGVFSAGCHTGGTAHTSVCACFASFAAITCHIGCFFRKPCHESFPLFLSGMEVISPIPIAPSATESPGFSTIMLSTSGA